MNTRYQILDCEVDFTEQTLVRAGVVYKQQHKVMQVLRCLIQRKGELVSIDELMNEVWPDTVVSPNTLQRCIAQLRKGFGDASQAQTVIKTYPKRGYALVADVAEIKDHFATIDKAPLHAEQNTADRTSFEHPSSKHLNTRRLGVMALSIIVVMFVSVMITMFHGRLNSSEPNHAHVKAVMTASDAHTGKPRYAPDGKHLIFQRYSDFCQSSVWLQNVDNKQEMPLTQVQKRINDVAWAPDGQRLLIAQSNPCIAPTHEQCWQLELLTLDGAMQLEKSQAIGSCEHKPIAQVAWLNEQSALLIEPSENGLRQLTRIDVPSGRKQAFFTSGDVLSFTLLEAQRLAILSHQGSAQLSLFTVSEAGEVLQTQSLKYSDALSAFSFSTLSYSSSDSQLLLENNGQLFEIDDNGEIKLRAILPNSLSDFSVSKNVIAATRGQTKQDGVLQHLNGGEQVVLFPSKGVETDFRFAPHSDAIAFVSNRTEALQVWVSDNLSSPAKQLSQFATPKQINGIEWLATGDGLVLVINDQLATLTLAGKLHTYPLPMRVKYLHQALPNNQVLIEYQHDYKEVLARLDLNTLQITPLHFGLFNGAQLDVDDNLWFIDRDSQLHRLVGGEVTLLLEIRGVNGLRAYQQGVVVSSKQRSLSYLVAFQNEPRTLWSLAAGSWLQDIKGEDFIWAYEQARNSDIVELALQD